MRTSSAAPSDHPASRSGLMNGPLDENASADATPMIKPVVRIRALEPGAALGRATVRDAVEVMGRHPTVRSETCLHW
ncbi:hypothetical protein GCM10025760_32570 [Microbacterium yannicii]|uniref:Uncharacterized protein n=1 Tax=Microbacterium yannicii TaxID=671622 RepID=A0ABP9MLZ2_9MICO